MFRFFKRKKRDIISPVEERAINKTSYPEIDAAIEKVKSCGYNNRLAGLMVLKSLIHDYDVANLKEEEDNKEKIYKKIIYCKTKIPKEDV